MAQLLPQGRKERLFYKSRGVTATVSHTGYLTARETEIIRILRVLSEATDGFVVIGGYAVNAHGQHRFSIDCDLATIRNNIPVIDATVLGEGYALWKGRFRPPIGVTMREYRKSVAGLPVSVELLVNTVVSRQTSGRWTYKFIRENSVEAIVVGATDSTPSRVAQRNLLVAMKLHSGRTQDIADSVILSERVDWKEVARCAMRSDPTLLIKEAILGLESLRAHISEQKFRDSL